jgi:hypothetical protein
MQSWRAIFFALILLFSSFASLFLESQNASGRVLYCPSETTAEKFKDTNIIFSGKVTEIAYTISMTYIKFHVLNKWKGISSSDITIAASDGSEAGSGGPNFHLGDNYLDYVIDNQYGYIYQSCWGEPLASATDEINVLKAIVSNPRQQITHGVMPDNVLCSGGLVLMKKLSGNSVACVKPETDQKLVKLGWGTEITSITQINNQDRLLLTVGKTVYTLGEKIPITIKNTSNMTLEFPDVNFGIQIQDASTNWVCCDVSGNLTYLPPNGNYTFVWNQGDQHYGSKVKSGNYTIVVFYWIKDTGMSNIESKSIEIK